MVFDDVGIFKIWKYYFVEYGKELENMKRIFQGFKQDFCLFLKQSTLINMYSCDIYLNTICNKLVYDYKYVSQDEST